MHRADIDPSQARFEAWEVVLDRLELDVIRTERALASGAGLPRPLDSWHVPDDYGPVPAALRARAEEVLGRQRDAVRHLAEALDVTEAHQAYVAGATRRTGGGPVYVDLNA